MKKPISPSLPGLLLLGFIVLLCMGCTQKTRSFEQMRQSFRETLIGPESLDRTDSIVVKRIEAMDRSAEQSWKSLNKASDRTFLWEDCEVPGKSTLTLIPYSKLYGMALVYSTPGSKFYGNDSLKRDVIAGMEWMDANRYNPSIELYDNWWMFVIGTPLNITRIMTLLYDDLTPDQKARYEAAMNHYAPNVTYEGASTGANKVWQCAAMAARGFLTNDPAKLQMAVDGLDTEFTTATTGDGFYEDGSFVQHQWHAYTGGYGRSLLDNLTGLIEMVHGSQWEIPQEKIAMLYGWIHNAYEPLLYRGAFMDMTRGREIARPGSGDRGTGHSVLQLLFRLSLLSELQEKTYLQSVVKREALADHERDLINDIPFHLISRYRQMMSDMAVVPAERPVCDKIFAGMDRAVHTTPVFGLGIALSSARIEGYETINTENLKGWYIGDGMTYLYDNDLKQYSDQFWPTVNPYRMAGTTVDTRPRRAETLPLAPGLLYADGYKSPRYWAGGSSIANSFGSVGMWLDAYESTLEAKKSWFMASNQVVALGAGINSRDNRTIETIVENRKLNPGATYAITFDTGKPLLAKSSKQNVSARWVHFQGDDEGTAVGYYFPQSSSLKALREERRGSWHEINTTVKDTASVVRDYFTLWFDHGVNPSDATYAYVLLPGLTSQQLAAYALKPDVEILANTAQVQAVHFRTEGVTGINFWEAGELAGIRVDAPASITLQEGEEKMTIGVSDPTQLSSGKITVQVNRPYGTPIAENPAVTVLSTAPTLTLEVNMQGSLGRTREIAFTKL